MDKIPLSEEIENKANEEAKFLYSYLKNKYPNKSIEHLDIILNSLSMALLILMYNHVNEANHEAYAKDVVGYILSKGVKKLSGEQFP